MTSFWIGFGAGILSMSLLIVVLVMLIGRFITKHPQKAMRTGMHMMMRGQKNGSASSPANPSTELAGSFSTFPNSFLGESRKSS